MKRTMKKRFLASTLVLCLVLSLLPVESLADTAGSVSIDEAHFPDEPFRAYVSEQFDTNKDNVLSADELSKITSIFIGDNGDDAYISSLQGIEYFPNLEELVSKGMTEVDVSHNPKLKKLSVGLYIMGNMGDAPDHFTLDTSNNPELTYLSVGGSRLDGVDLTNNTKLTYLNLNYSSQLTSLDLSKNVLLKELYCQETGITELDVSHCPELEKLDCSSSRSLTTLNITGCTKLKTLSCSGCKIGSLDISQSSELETLNCSYNQITSLNVTGCSKLTKLECGDNELTNLDVTSCPQLTELNCRLNALTSLDVTNNKELTSLGCGTKLTSLNIEKNTKLESLDCTGEFSELDLSKNTELTSLTLTSNQLTEVDTSNNTKLTKINFSGANLENVDFSQNVLLTTLTISKNEKIHSLDLSKNTALEGLAYVDSVLSTLDLSNNTNLRTLSLGGCQLLSLSLGSSFTQFSMSDVGKQTYRTTITSESFDLAEIDPNIDASQITSINGAYLDGTVISGYWQKLIAYTYSIPYGNGNTATMTVNLQIDESLIPDKSCGANVTWDYDATTKTVTISGTGRMADYLNTTEIPWRQYEIEAAVIEEGVTSVCAGAFSMKRNLTSVTLPSTLVEIGASAFGGTSIQTIDFPEGLEKIGDSAFGGTKLTTVVIPGSVKSIGEWAFSGVPLTNLVLNEGLETIARMAFVNTNIQNLTLPSTVTYVDSWAISDCEYLTTVEVKGATTFSGCVFGDDPNLEKVIYSGDVRFAGGAAGLFVRDDKIQTVGPIGSGCNIEYSWTEKIPDYAFYSDCGSITTVYLPDTIKSIGVGSFKGIYWLTDIYYDGTEAQWKQVSIDNSDWNNWLICDEVTYHFKECHHVWADISEKDDDGHYRYCTVCGAKQTGGQTCHSYNAWTISKPATLGSSGEIKRLCETCQYQQTKSFSIFNWMQDEDVVNAISASVQKVIEDIKSSKDTTSVSKETAQEIQDAYNAGAEINATPILVEVNKEQVPYKQRIAMSSAIYAEGENATIGQYFDVSILLTAEKDGAVTQLGTLNELDETISCALEIPESLQKDGRTFSVVRYHDGAASVLSDCTVSNGSIQLETDQFSTYALVYYDAADAANNQGSGSNPSSGPTYYRVSVSSTSNGTISVSSTVASQGTTITLTVTPNSGYVLNKLTVTNSSGNAVTLTNAGSGKYTFVMPNSQVSIDAGFTVETPSTSGGSGTGNEGTAPNNPDVGGTSGDGEDSTKPDDSGSSGENSVDGDSNKDGASKDDNVVATQEPVKDAEAVKIEADKVAVVLSSYTLKANGTKQVKPTVSVYTSSGTKLKVSKNYTVAYANNIGVGKATVTVTIITDGYTFQDGTTTQTVEYQIVDKSEAVLSAKNVTVNFGATKEEIQSKAKVTLKVGSQKVNLSSDSIELTIAEVPNVGVYPVTVTATYNDVSYTATILVTVKPAKVTLKSVKLDSVNLKVAVGLDKAELESRIKAKIIANSTLKDGDFDVNVTNDGGVTTLSKAKSVKISYTVTLKGGNKTFTSGKSVTEKSAKATLKVTK